MGFFSDDIRFRIAGQRADFGPDDLREFQLRSTLVCGGRDFDDAELMSSVLDLLRPTIVIEGGYRGADTIARLWAKAAATHCATVPAQWDEFGGRAGPIRNSAMLLLRPGVVVAMPGGNGTRDMCRSAHTAGVPVIRVFAGTDNT